MSDPKTPDDQPPPPEDQGTIFNPQVRTPAQTPPAPEEAREEPAAEPWGDPDATAVSPQAAPDDGEETPGWDEAGTEIPTSSHDGGEWGQAPEPEPEPEPVTRPPTATISGLRDAPIKPQPHAQGIKVGDVLNHIFEVKRFIARGGMGEVFEAMNVNSDERVAVKVMLPSLAADPNVISMFRREARTMTRLHHEALVQYRVLAQEPQLGVLYIVTEFIDGVSLGDVLGTIKANADDLAMLLRRLASGLRAAHNLGVLHRDMSPDNVLLEGGRLSSAKVVDFGIAKDLNPGSATIIGDGFAGKLGYVAPEQLGDFNRELGPWTDVYSLGLVILATAIGRDVQMGGTLVDAVDKRRHGPDLSAVPDRIRPVLEGMLKANPTERLRSMDEVIEALDGNRAAPPPEPSGTSGADKGAGGGGSKRNLVIAGVAGALLLGTAGWFALSGSGDDPAANVSSADTGAPGPAAARGDPAANARGAINSAIPSIPCSWLDIVDLQQAGGQVSVVMGGVAGSPAAAQTEIAGALDAAGVANANIDFASVAQIQPGGCAAIDAYRQIRNMEAPRLVTDQRKWEIRRYEDSPVEVARVVVRVKASPGEDMTLFGIEPSGAFSELLNSRNDFDTKGAEYNITKRGPDDYEIQSDLDHEGWSGLILLTGKGPFPADLLRPPLGSRSIAWKEQLSGMASERGWKSDMLWVKTANERPGD